MSGLTRVLKSIKRGESLIITPRIDQWLVQHPEGLLLDEDGLAVLERLVTRTASGERSGRFGASSLGTKCPRQQVYSYLGMPTTGMRDPFTQNLFNDGTWRHIRWQLMGLQAGVFTHVEWPVAVPQLRLKTSLDALNVDEGWFFELKGDRNWTRSMDGIPDGHNMQIHACFLATGWDVCVYVMEDKTTQQWKEIIVRKDKAIIQRVRKELAILNESVEHQRLPPVLQACKEKAGYYPSCPYGPQCLAQSAVGDEWPTLGAW